MITHFLDHENDNFTVNGTVIDKDSAKHKYGGDPMAEYLRMLSMDSLQDEETGTVDWVYWCGRFGKRLLFTDDHGFVWVEKFATEAEAVKAFEGVAAEYGVWADLNEW